MQTFIGSIKSEQELKEIIDSREKYLPETVEAAAEELQKRGHVFTHEELTVINDDVLAHRHNATLVSSRVGLFSREYKDVIVEDPAAPLMYSRRVLYLFTLFMGAFFGSIMLAMNVAKTEKRSMAILVILFGIGFSVAQYLVITKINSNSPGSIEILGGLISAVCLDYFFWKNFIGYSTFYRARPFWVPLTIAILLAALVIWAAMYSSPH
jgi:hypothetical protein